MCALYGLWVWISKGCQRQALTFLSKHPERRDLQKRISSEKAARRRPVYGPMGSVVRCAPKAPTMCRTFGILTSNRPVTAIGWLSPASLSVTGRSKNECSHAPVLPVPGWTISAVPLLPTVPTLSRLTTQFLAPCVVRKLDTSPSTRTFSPLNVARRMAVAVKSPDRRWLCRPRTCGRRRLPYGRPFVLRTPGGSFRKRLLSQQKPLPGTCHPPTPGALATSVLAVNLGAPVFSTGKSYRYPDPRERAARFGCDGEGGQLLGIV